MNAKQPLMLTLAVPSAAASSVDTNVFVVPEGYEYELAEVKESHTVAGSDGSAVTADVVKCDSGTAPGSGTSMLGSTFDLKSTANTPVTKTAGNEGLSSSLATRTLRSGQTLAINFGGTLTALAGLAFTFVLIPRKFGTHR